MHTLAHFYTWKDVHVLSLFLFPNEICGGLCDLKITIIAIMVFKKKFLILKYSCLEAVKYQYFMTSLHMYFSKYFIICWLAAI